jgi:hypothetical protein
MARTRAEITSWERRWGPPVAIATFVGVVLMVGSGFASAVKGEGEAEILRSVHEHGGSVILGGIMQAIAFALLAVPLYYLFRVVQARSERVRSQLVGLVIVAPLFLAVSSGLSGAAQTEAAKQFVGGEAKSTLSAKEAHEKCVSDNEKPLAACEKRKIEDKQAENAFGESSLAPFVAGFRLAGGLGFAVAIVYSCLWAMRTGIMTRFWASLGMALGVASLLGLIFFTLIWFVYFALLVLGKVPGGRPPAWEAGEAIPWPAPGEPAESD